MAIGPEQLDIKKLAKIFLTQTDLNAVLTKEIILQALKQLDNNDWAQLQDAMFVPSDEHKALYKYIDACREFIATADIGVYGRNVYLKDNMDVFALSVEIAHNIARTTLYDNSPQGLKGGVILRDTLKALKTARHRLEHTTLIESSVALSDGRLYSFVRPPYAYFGGNVEWMPRKVLRALVGGVEQDVEITIHQPSNDNNIHIRGIYLITNDGKKLLITMQESVNINGVNYTIESLMKFGEFKDVILRNGTLITNNNGRLSSNLLLCEVSTDGGLNESEIAAHVSRYFEQNINVLPFLTVPAVPGVSSKRMLVPGAFASLMAGLGSNGVLNDEAQSATGCEGYTIDPEFSPSHIILSSSAANVQVDNIAGVVTGFDPTKVAADAIVANGTVTIIQELKTITVENVNATIPNKTFKYCTEVVKIDAMAETPEGLLIGEHRPVDTETEWIPAKYITNRYIISPMKINEKAYVAKNNEKLIQVPGLILNDIVFTCHKLPSYLATDAYKLSVAKVGIYNGCIFGSKADRLAYEDRLRTYLAPLYEKIIWVESEFKEIIDNLTGEGTGQYYWEGNSGDIIHLPDSREDMIFYLNATSIKSKPVPTSETV